MLRTPGLEDYRSESHLRIHPDWHAGEDRMSGGGDSSFVQVEVGYVVPPDNLGPVTSSVTTAPIPALLNGLVTVTANVSDDTTGNNNVASAEYQLNGDAAGRAMTCFGWRVQRVRTRMSRRRSPPSSLERTRCACGAPMRWAIPVCEACQTFLVTYKFTGFFSPIDNDPREHRQSGTGSAGKVAPYRRQRRSDRRSGELCEPLFLSHQLHRLRGRPAGCRRGSRLGCERSPVFGRWLLAVQLEDAEGRMPIPAAPCMWSSTAVRSRRW